MCVLYIRVPYLPPTGPEIAPPHLSSQRRVIFPPQSFPLVSIIYRPHLLLSIVSLTCIRLLASLLGDLPCLPHEPPSLAFLTCLLTYLPHVPFSRTSLTCLPHVPPSSASLTCFPHVTCLPHVPPSRDFLSASLTCLSHVHYMPPSHASLSCLPLLFLSVPHLSTFLVSLRYLFRFFLTGSSAQRDPISSKHIFLICLSYMPGWQSL
jgi:hypothetical protein